MNEIMLMVDNHIASRKRRRPAVCKSSIARISSLLLCLLSTLRQVKHVAAQQQQDPQTLNGGSVLAMAGKGCVAVAVDKRFGSGPQTVNISPRHVLAPNPSLLVAFTGLDGDVRSLSEELSVQISARVGRESGFGFEDKDSDGNDSGDRDLDEVPPTVSSPSRHITPRSMAALTSHVLYGRRRSPYFVEPIIAGLERIVVTDNTGANNEGGIKKAVRYTPFLCCTDVIGAMSRSDSFVCSGAASKSMHGTAQALWQPNLEPEELARVCGRAFLSALERDCLSGYGAIVYLIVAEPNGCSVVEYDLACRND